MLGRGLEFTAGCLHFSICIKIIWLCAGLNRANSDLMFLAYDYTALVSFTICFHWNENKRQFHFIVLYIDYLILELHLEHLHVISQCKYPCKIYKMATIGGVVAQANDHRWLSEARLINSKTCHLRQPCARSALEKIFSKTFQL